jgi:hypothetical protein
MPVHVTLEAVKHWAAVPERHVLPEAPPELEGPPGCLTFAESSPTLLSCPGAAPVLSLLHPAAHTSHAAHPSDTHTANVRPDRTIASIASSVKSVQSRGDKPTASNEAWIALVRPQASRRERQDDYFDVGE